MVKWIPLIIILALMAGVCITMAIKHERTVSAGDKGMAEDWNKDHLVTEPSQAKRSVTFIVTANDSEDKGRADYVCDGTADQVEINTAITDLPAVGGRVLLLEGTYNLGAPILLDNNVTLSGQGKNTKLVSVVPAWGNIRATNKVGMLIENLYRDGQDLVVSGIAFINCSDSMISNNWIEDCDGDGIEIIDSSRIQIIGNNVINSNEGMRLNNANDFVVVGNALYDNDNAIMLVTGSKNCIVVANSCVGGSGNGITLLTNADKNIVASNRCRTNTGWGVNVQDATCDKNLIHGNVLLDNTAGALRDLGTGTLSADNIVA